MIDGQSIDHHAALELRAGQAVELVNGDQPSEFLMLQDRLAVAGRKRPRYFDAGALRAPWRALAA